MTSEELKRLSKKHLRSLLKELAIGGVGMKEIFLKRMIEDELTRREEV